MANLASSIASISGGGGISALWLGGKNPSLQKEIAMMFNLADDTSYLSMAPSTSSQTILTGEAAQYTQTYACDIKNYDWLVIYDAVIPHIYTQTPSTSYTISHATKNAYYIGRQWNGLETSNTNFRNTSIQLQLGSILRYYYSGIIRNASTGTSYGINATLPGRVGSINSTADTITLSIYNPAVYMRTNSSFMDSNSWQYLDADATNIYFRCQIFRIDKGGGAISMASNMMHDACVADDGTMASNEIIWGA